jgi:imidazolonepropionase-like amidohydrolase
MKRIHCISLGRALLGAAALGALATSATAGNEGKVVIEAGRIVTMAGEDIQNGRIVIDNGRITAMGPADSVEKPWDAVVLGGPDLVAFPGLIEAHTSSGMDRSNESLDVAPFLDIRDSIDPVAYYFEDSLRSGATTINVQQGANCVIGGRGMIVKPFGMTVEQMAMRPQHGLKLSAQPKSGKSRATQAQALRGAFADLRDYLEETVAKERDDRGQAQREALFQGRDLEEEKGKGRAMGGSSWKVEGLELIPRGAIDEKYLPLLELVEGRHAAYFHCGGPLDVVRALEVARANGFLARTTLILEAECWKAADRIAEAGVPVVLEGDLVEVSRDQITGEETETFVPAILREKGIRFALSAENPSSRSLTYQAALAVGRGLERQVALEAITKVPAEILGMADQIGSLEVGKLGNVVLFSGDPLSVTSWVEHVVLEGTPVYDRRDDLRVKQLLEGTQPPGTAPATMAEGSSGHEHGDGEETGQESDEDEKTDQKEEEQR